MLKLRKRWKQLKTRIKTSDRIIHEPYYKAVFWRHFVDDDIRSLPHAYKMVLREQNWFLNKQKEQKEYFEKKQVELNAEKFQSRISMRSFHERLYPPKKNKGVRYMVYRLLSPVPDKLTEFKQNVSYLIHIALAGLSIIEGIALITKGVNSLKHKYFIRKIVLKYLKK